MTETEALARLTALLVEDFHLEPARVTAEAHLRLDLGLDSLSLTDLVFLIRQDFGITGDPERFRGAHTVGALATRIAQALSSAPPDAP